MAQAISIPTAQQWSGNDGPWSTFVFDIGIPTQQVNLLPNTQGSSILVVSDIVCETASSDSTICQPSRGGQFVPNSSNSYRSVTNSTGGKQFEFTILEQQYPGAIISGVEGIDDVGIGVKDITIQNQLIQTFDGFQPWLGYFGLAVGSSNTTAYSSPLDALLAQGSVESLYWAYTAGASYRNVHGSLTFGGYDALRGDISKSPIWNFEAGSNDIRVALNDITFSDSANQSNHSPIYVSIDSTVPEIWLPLEACQSFEAAFNLTYNSYLDVYPVGDEHHARLLAQNASVTFSVGRSTTDNASNGTQITIPYSAFDLSFSYPYFNIEYGASSVRYFPLQRAMSEDQYFLGRVFLQEAYLAVNYNLSEFYIVPAQFPESGSTETNLITIPGNRSTAGHSTLSTGAIAGIAVAGAIALLSVILISFAKHRRRKRRRFNNQFKTQHFAEENENYSKAQTYTNNNKHTSVDDKPELEASFPTTTHSPPPQFPSSPNPSYSKHASELPSSPSLNSSSSRSTTKTITSTAPAELESPHSSILRTPTSSRFSQRSSFAYAPLPLLASLAVPEEEVHEMMGDIPGSEIDRGDAAVQRGGREDGG